MKASTLRFTCHASFLVSFAVVATTSTTAQSAGMSGGRASKGSASLPNFEVATVKPAKQDNHRPIGLYIYPGGKVVAGQCTLTMLIGYAFDVQAFQVTGGPSWLNEDLFDLSALPPDSPNLGISNHSS